MKIIKQLLFILLATIIISGCANMASGPTGGRTDSEPPKFVKSTPAQNEKNFKGKRVEILFDEYVQVPNVTENFIVSPPHRSLPSVKAIGKKVVVEFKDSLQPDATYTLDFGNCIGDYTENNPIRNYCHTFATGDVLDTLTIAGTVLNAEDLTPAPNVIVGIYSSNEDSLFTTTRFERVGKTNASGRFFIRGVAGKQYYIYALQDLNNNYYFDQVGEGIALPESPLPIPSIKYTTTYDTIYKDSLTIDTIKTKTEKQYLPDTFLLRLFHKEVKLQEFDKIERPHRNYFTLYFKKEEKSLPTIKPINFEANDWYIVDANKASDTLRYWITDTTVLNMDSLKLSIEYLKTDTAENFVTQIDTLFAGLTNQYIKNEEKQKKKDETLEKRYEKVGVKKKRTNILKLSKKPRTVEIYDTVSFIWENPVLEYHEDMFHLSYKEDTIKIGTPIKLKMGENKRSFQILSEITPGVRYTLEIDSAAVRDYYKNHNNKEAFSFSKKEDEEYGSIKLNINGTEGTIIVQLINSYEDVIREFITNGHQVEFKHLDSGTYYVKAINDRNGDGKWTTGDYKSKTQPEEVFYLNKALKLRKGWGMEEDWNINDRPSDSQRPSEIKKKDTKKNNR